MRPPHAQYHRTNADTKCIWRTAEQEEYIDGNQVSSSKGRHLQGQASNISPTLLKLGGVHVVLCALADFLPPERKTYRLEVEGKEGKLGPGALAVALHEAIVLYLCTSRWTAINLPRSSGTSIALIIDQATWSIRFDSQMTSRGSFFY